VTNVSKCNDGGSTEVGHGGSGMATAVRWLQLQLEPRVAPSLQLGSRGKQLMHQQQPKDTAESIPQRGKWWSSNEVVATVKQGKMEAFRLSSSTAGCTGSWRGSSAGPRLARWSELARSSPAWRRHGHTAVRCGGQDQWLPGFLFLSYLERDASLGEAKLAEVLVLPPPA
jgi:hypothetical protein